MRCLCGRKTAQSEDVFLGWSQDKTHERVIGEKEKKKERKKPFFTGNKFRNFGTNVFVPAERGRREGGVYKRFVSLCYPMNKK